MARLEDYRSRQSMAVMVEAGADVVAGPGPGSNAVGLDSIGLGQPVAQGPADSAEKNNFRMAQALRDAKARLIGALSQFPATALWLLNEHGQNPYGDRQANGDGGHPKSAHNLGLVQHCFLQASPAFGPSAWANGPCRDSRQQLRLELAKFPYAFEDLVKLVDVMVFAYKYRGLCCQPAGNRVKDKAEIINRRLEGMGRRTKLDAAKFNGLIKTCAAQPYGEQSLFLAISEMQGLFCDVLMSEHCWLAARQRLAAANSRLVLFIANQYRGSFLAFDDLVQEGQVGLLKAVDRFDHRLGFQFSTYAGYWIRQAISRALSRSERVVRVPCGQVANINKVFRAKEALSAKTGAEASVKELAGHTRFTENEINALLSISQPPVPLENLGGEDGGQAPIDFLEQRTFAQPFAEMAGAELERLMADAIKTLDAREAKIIRNHFGIGCGQGMTLQDIGAELGLTRERVRQVEAKALTKLKDCFGQKLMAFL